MNTPTRPEDVFLTPEEDLFCLTVIEYNGNLKAAYAAVFGDQVTHPLARAKLLLAKPEIQARIADLNEVTREHSLVSLESHLLELAEIRDLAKIQGALKVAFSAEEARGKAAGLYVTKVEETSKQHHVHEVAQAQEFVTEVMDELLKARQDANDRAELDKK